jgi:hypothetical protein
MRPDSVRDLYLFPSATKLIGVDVYRIVDVTIVDENGGSGNGGSIVDKNVKKLDCMLSDSGTIPGIGGQYLLPTGSTGGRGYPPRLYTEYIPNLLDYMFYN